VLILLMLIVIPLLTVNDADMSLTIGASVIHNLAVLASSDPTTYQSGLDLAIEVTKKKLPLIQLAFNGVNYYYNDRVTQLRSDEMANYEYSTSGFDSSIIFDQKVQSVQNALFSIYTTSFVISLLLVRPDEIQIN
jgi:hypothetical protein